MPITVSEKAMPLKQIATPFRRWLCLALAAAIIFGLFYPGGQPFAAGLFPEPWDKPTHFAVYAMITYLLYVGSAGAWPLLLIVAVGAIGALDEWHQIFVPGRSASLMDLLTDVIASICVIMLYQCSATRLAETPGGHNC